MSTLHVRPARPDDVALVLALVRELAEYEQALEQAVASEEMMREALFGARPACEALIGEIDGTAAGLALYFHTFSTWTGKRGLYLEDLFVRPTARGKGLGEALLTRVAQIAVERGCPRVEWLVVDWNTPARGFYEKLGAVPLTEWTIHRLSGAALDRIARRGRA